MHEDIANKLIQLVEEDQKLRNNIPEDECLQDAYWEKINKSDLVSTNYLKQVVNQIGLPSISKVGEKASYNAWLIVQHSPDLEFQKEYLALLKANQDDIILKNMAYLEDRVLMYEGKPQIYGTQLVQAENSELFVPYKVKDRENVNILREKVGLGTIEDYLEDFNED